MGAEPVFPLRTIIHRIEQRLEGFKRALIDALDGSDVEFRELFGDSAWGQKMINLQNGPWSAQQEGTWYSLRMAVLELILIESLCNAVAYYYREITLSFSVTGENSPGAGLNVCVKNDVYPGLEIKEGLPGKGIASCMAAAAAVNGTYSSQYDAVLGLWLTQISLPAVVLPRTLAHLFQR
jgi:hypothetical protein